jgi:sulfhydrogenase subunit alpha
MEYVHDVDEPMGLIDDLLGMSWEEPPQAVIPRSGIGVGAGEVPRCILYHTYEFDGDGRIVPCDYVIPTSENHANPARPQGVCDSRCVTG